MILTGNEDIRVQKTIESIQKAFHDLIMKKDYEKITVKEICEQARINKKTFYVYYETKDALLWEIQKAISSEYSKRIQNLSLKDIDKLIREFFLFSEEQGPFYEKITCGGTYSKIRQKMINQVEDGSSFYAELEDLPVEKREIIQTFIADSLLGIYKKWIASNKALPVDTIIELATELLSSGINNYIEK